MFERQIVRYVIVAVLAYLIDFGGFFVLLHAGLPLVWANVAVKIAAAIFGFFVHRKFTYRIKGYGGAWAHAAKYFGIAFIYTPASTMVLLIMTQFISNVAIAKFGADVLLFLITYFITSKFVFLRN
ncbi:putative flippase GtrA [Silvimonas terrae]|uniref:Putative flippase GtrA n=1 Tax=Silvimonas terrae TaxID=300266 RepID=A0A840RJ17_9NEIS|nr:GtrA family protein [Silvimonas terrae]MBB5192470.1 putative flippase GtrA [Silvimonas terrae]